MYLLEKHGEDFISRIVPHEVAHIVAHYVFPNANRPHGREWKSVMRFFEADDTVTHEFDSKPARKIRRFAYGCRCSEGHYLTKRAHDSVRRGRVEYSCRECGDPLVFRGSVH
jgi:SprT protein